MERPRPDVERPTPGLRALLEIEAELDAITSLGATPAGELRLVPITGGTVTGEGLRARILPGGSDWQDVRSDGAIEISARYLLETEAGERIEVRSNGLRAAAPEVLAQLARGEPVPMSRYYFRTAMRFRTAAPRWLRLNDVLAVAYGERRVQSVRLDVYEVL